MSDIEKENISAIDSEDSTTEHTGRKRIASEEIYRRNKKSTRTVARKIDSKREEEMNEMKDMMREMMQEIKEVRKSQTSYEQEIKMLKGENIQLKERISKLENKLNRLENKDRRNNIIVKGVKFNEIDLKQEVENFLKKELNLSTKIIEVELIKPKTVETFVVAKVGSWQEKMEIMKGKHRLRGTQKYIDDDLSREERKVQLELRNIAKREREKGNEAKVGYKKVFINKERWNWDEDKLKIEKHVERSSAKN